MEQFDDAYAAIEKVRDIVSEHDGVWIKESVFDDVWHAVKHKRDHVSGFGAASRVRIHTKGGAQLIVENMLYDGNIEIRGNDIERFSDRKNTTGSYRLLYLKNAKNELADLKAKTCLEVSAEEWCEKELPQWLNYYAVN